MYVFQASRCPPKAASAPVPSRRWGHPRLSVGTGPRSQLGFLQGGGGSQIQTGSKPGREGAPGRQTRESLRDLNLKKNCHGIEQPPHLFPFVDVGKIDLDLITPNTIEGGIPFRKCGCYDNREEAINIYHVRGAQRPPPCLRGRPAAGGFRGVGTASWRPVAPPALLQDGRPGPTPGLCPESSVAVARPALLWL